MRLRYRQRSLHHLVSACGLRYGFWQNSHVLVLMGMTYGAVSHRTHSQAPDGPFIAT